mmetsp:Transcript_172751/g.420206  ORF Transcript_172751/g.420206 Transcript_172751/m.420206 type:complete len:98 (-) Transcript_172751:1089-1382(-)
MSLARRSSSTCPISTRALSRSMVKLRISLAKSRISRSRSLEEYLLLRAEALAMLPLLLAGLSGSASEDVAAPLGPLPPEGLGPPTDSDQADAGGAAC